MHNASTIKKAPDRDSDRPPDGPRLADRAILANEAVRHDPAAAEHPASWKIEVVADDSGKWEGDPFRFKTRDEALAYARNLEFRWSAVRDWRVVQSQDHVNQGWPLRRENGGNDGNV